MAGDDSERKHDSCGEFFSNHTKTIVTLVMIFGTILCIVLIVMVHKWRFDSNKAEEIQACLDVAVIGAGLSGSYATWRMRHNTQSKIHLFEYSDRVGGRLYTHKLLDHTPPLAAELGALYYLPQRHLRLSQVIRVLHLTHREYYPPSRDQPTYYLRGRHRTSREVRTHTDSYSLKYWERNKTPLELKRYYTERYLNQSIHKDPLSVKYKGISYLSDIGYHSFLNDVATREGFNFLQDGVPWRSHVSNGNAALLAALDLDTWDKHYTLDDGLDSLPKAMVRQFENSSDSHEFHPNRRLSCINKEDGYYTLIFQNTATVNGVTSYTGETTKTCSRQVVLAISPSALKEIKFTGFDDEDDNDLHRSTPSIYAEQYLDPVPAMTAYHLYDGTWWNGPSPAYTDVITDIPLRRMQYIGRTRKQDSSPKNGLYSSDNYLFLVASPDMDDVGYFDQYIKSVQLNKRDLANCSVSVHYMADIKRQIAKVQEVTDDTDIEEPVDIVLKDWRDFPFGAGWHMWKQRVNWKSAAQRLRQPFDNEAIYIVGSDVCPGPCQFWAEGALQTVEELFQAFNNSDEFRRAFLAPIATEL